MIKRIKAELKKTLHLPRFTLFKGQVWGVRVDRLERHGFSLGGGFVYNEDYKVIK